MPRASQKPCNQMGCPILVSRGARYCPNHRRALYAAQNAARRADAGRHALDTLYNGPRWRKYRAWFLRQHPYCAECERAGRTAVAVIVDHILAVLDGGDFWDEANHQGLCDPCHRAKSAREVFGRARVPAGDRE